MRFNGFDLNQLVCLKALLSERNITRAAEQVNLSQSAMSTALGHLRRHFDDPLLARSGRFHILTPFAESLIVPLNLTLANAHELAACRPDNAERNVDRELRIVASDYTIRACLNKATKNMRENWPNLRFDILPLSEGSPRLLSNGEVDLVLAGQSFDIGVPPSTCLLEDKFVSIACLKAASDIKKLSTKEFSDREHVVVRYFDHQMTFEDEDSLRKSGVSRDRRITTWSHTHVASLVCGTSMLGTVPARIAYDLIKRWPIKIFPFPFEHEPIRVFAYWHTSRNSDTVLSEFVAMAKAIASRTLEWDVRAS